MRLGSKLRQITLHINVMSSCLAPLEKIFWGGVSFIQREFSKKSYPQISDITSSDIFAGNGRKMLMVELKFIEKCFLKVLLNF